MFRTIPGLLAFALATNASAQEPTHPSGQFAVPHIHDAHVDAADSAAFGQFVRSMRPIDPDEATKNNVSGYRLAWILSEHGGIAVLTRGDSSAPAQHERNVLQGGQEFVLPFRTAGGKHGLCIVSDIPCGLICRTTWYFVEE
ncbi:MAG: hypothetical protein ACK46G_00735 [Flavobacteriales bacterium]